MAEELGSPDGADEAEENAGSGEDAGLAEDDSVDRTAGSSEGDPHADLASALRDGVGDKSVESDDTEYKGESSEDADEIGNGPVEVG